MKRPKVITRRFLAQEFSHSNGDYAPVVDFFRSQELQELQAWESESGYIVLGEAGLGKSTALKKEAERNGEPCMHVNEFMARSDLPTDKMLFIDGTDEVDGLYNVHAKLAALGWPRYRLAARKEYWVRFRDTYWKEQRPRELFLQPLTEEQQQELVGADKLGQLRALRKKGLRELLGHPMFLLWLTKEDLPAQLSKTAIVKEMARVHAAEHDETRRQRQPGRIAVPTAQEWAAKMLLTGETEIPVTYVVGQPQSQVPAMLGEVDAGATASKLMNTHKTKAAFHRLFAETLGATWLAESLEKRNVTARRLYALMSSEMRIRPQLRGLAGALASMREDFCRLLARYDIATLTDYLDGQRVQQPEPWLDLAIRYASEQQDQEFATLRSPGVTSLLAAIPLARAEKILAAHGESSMQAAALCRAAYMYPEAEWFKSLRQQIGARVTAPDSSEYLRLYAALAWSPQASVPDRIKVAQTVMANRAWDPSGEIRGILLRDCVADLKVSTDYMTANAWDTLVKVTDPPQTKSVDYVFKHSVSEIAQIVPAQSLDKLLKIQLSAASSPHDVVEDLVVRILQERGSQLGRQELRTVLVAGLDNFEDRSQDACDEIGNWFLDHCEQLYAWWDYVLTSYFGDDPHKSHAMRAALPSWLWPFPNPAQREGYPQQRAQLAGTFASWFAARAKASSLDIDKVRLLRVAGEWFEVAGDSKQASRKKLCALAPQPQLQAALQTDFESSDNFAIASADAGDLEQATNLAVTLRQLAETPSWRGLHDLVSDFGEAPDSLAWQPPGSDFGRPPLRRAHAKRRRRPQLLAPPLGQRPADIADGHAVATESFAARIWSEPSVAAVVGKTQAKQTIAEMGHILQTSIQRLPWPTTQEVANPASQRWAAAPLAMWALTQTPSEMLSTLRHAQRQLMMCSALIHQPNSLPNWFSHCNADELAEAIASFVTFPSTWQLKRLPLFGKIGEAPAAVTKAMQKAAVRILPLLPSSIDDSLHDALGELLRIALTVDTANANQAIADTAAERLNHSLRDTERTIWHAAAMFAVPEDETTTNNALAFVGDNQQGEKRRKILLALVADKETILWPLRRLSEQTLVALITLCDSQEPGVAVLMGHLATRFTPEARKALQDLHELPAFENHKKYLRRLLLKQSEGMLEQAKPLTAAEFDAWLKDGKPVSVEDLQAHVMDLLHEYQEELRSGPTNRREAFWNKDTSDGKSKEAVKSTPQDENYCRDRIVESLRDKSSRYSVTPVKLATEQRETHNARADISCGDMGFPIECKCDTNREPFEAWLTQLDKYVLRSETEQRAIYCVFWFGQKSFRREKIASAADLQTWLDNALAAHGLSRRTAVVLDLTLEVTDSEISSI